MMGSVCADKFHHLKKPSPSSSPLSLREIDIPPRKLLGRRLSAEVFTMDSPGSESSGFFSRFLPCNDPHSSDSEDDSDDPYSSDHFRIYEFKIRKCNRSRSHDWTDCPFAHPGEKARRRDPRRFLYSGTVCPEFRKGGCGAGDACEFSHGVFECWLHPSRYRTEACKDGKSCKRKVCFFAHSAKQLRVVPDSPPSPPPPTPPLPERKTYCRNNNSELNFNRNCCVFCRSITASPTSTLMGMSPPEVSPADRRRAGLHEFMSASGLSYEEALAELLGGMSMGESGPGPSTPGRVGPSQLGFSGGWNPMEEERYNRSGPGPDLGWVNDLLT